MSQTDAPIEYMARTRAYYLALGYDMPYVWAKNDETPFQPLLKPLSQSRIAIVTTAAPFNPDAPDQGPGAPYNAAAKFYSVYQAPIDPAPSLYISHVAIDRDHTTAEDQSTYFPRAALQSAKAAGRVGDIAKDFYGLPTNRSQATTLDVDCPELVRRMTDAQIDAAILVPNCPVCHQSVTLAARTLEAAGIATVIMGCAKDIVEHAGAPRFVFSDFPLGNSAGRPNDPESQAQTLSLALDLLETAKTPNTTIQSPLNWNGAPDWKSDYSNPDKLTAAEIAKRKAAFDAAKSTAKSLRDG
jgi:glycine/betaine/sarcosine/D-proline reductase family selenoprotein B